MGTLFSLTLCLITLFSLASCASTSRTVAQESEVKRAPDYRYDKEFNRQYVRDRN